MQKIKLINEFPIYWILQDKKKSEIAHFFHRKKEMTVVIKCEVHALTDVTLHST